LRRGLETKAPKGAVKIDEVIENEKNNYALYVRVIYHYDLWGLRNFAGGQSNDKRGTSRGARAVTAGVRGKRSRDGPAT